MAKKIFFGNYKGGVGKTTSVYQIATWIAPAKKVLLIDLDPQCSLSAICARGNLSSFNYYQSLNYMLELYMRYLNNYLDDYKILTGVTPNLGDKLKNLGIIKRHSTNLDYIPSTLFFKNARLNDITNRMQQNELSIFSIPMIIKDLNLDSEYAYILFDCPPASNMLIHSIFMASDYFIIPTIGDEVSVNGVPDYITEIKNTSDRYCMNNKLGGIMISALFGEEPKFIGIFETIYKNRVGVGPVETLRNLDNAVNRLNVRALISDNRFNDCRHNITRINFKTKFIFKYRIRNLVGITRNTAEAEGKHPDYMELTQRILQITQ